MGLFIYFGVPGSGKTTLAAKFVYQNLKHDITTFSNVPIKGAWLFNASRDLGSSSITDCDLIIDEAGIEYNNRNFKAMPKHQIEWFKLYRHYNVRNIYVFSQSYEDMDITLRRLADRVYIVRRSLLPFFTSVKRVNMRIGIDENTHQLTDLYYFDLFGISLCFNPRYWPMFDSWACPPLPPGDFCVPDVVDFKELKKLTSFKNRIVRKFKHE